jgi:SAM-dependent methyltransferase
MIRRWSHGSADDSMSEDILVDLAAIIQRHPWWEARTALLLSLLGRIGVNPPASVLDAGCGWGVTLEALERKGFVAHGLDISRQALERLDRDGRVLIEADLAQLLPPDAPKYDAVIALDVIEHIDDDAGAIRALTRLTRPRGVVVVSVPALPELFTEFDAVQGHRRRYVPASLRQALAGSDLEIEQLFWWGGWLVPLFRLQRMRKRLRPQLTPAQIYRDYIRIPPWPVSSAFRAAFAYERGRALQGKVKRGTSLFAVARRVG